MTVLKSKYLVTVRRRLSEVAVQRADAPIEKPSVVRSDVRALLQAISHAEEELAKAARPETESSQSVEAP